MNSSFPIIKTNFEFIFYRLVFSQSLLSLDLIERFLDRVDKKHQEDLDKEKEKKSDEKEGDDEKSDEKKEGLNEEVDDLSVFPYHCVYNLTCARFKVNLQLFENFS